jgi:hypothetical protein
VSAAQRTPEELAARTPEQIASDLAETRNRLAKTIDDLTYRVKPQTIVSRQIESLKASFHNEDGSLNQQKILKIAGIGLGAVVAIVAIRKIAG